MLLRPNYVITTVLYTSLNNKTRMSITTEKVCDSSTLLGNLNITTESDNMPLQRLADPPHVRRQQSWSALNEFREWRPILAGVWICHFAASVLIIVWVSLQYEDDRKYIPIDVNAIEDQCSKAYVNVFASSNTDDGAIICCTSDNKDGICRSIPWYLFFARRLARLPEAWLLPLFPLLVRGIVHFATRRQRGAATSTDGTAFKRQKEINTLTIRRLCLYIGLIQIRGWILYLLFNKIENQIVEPAGDNCWYDSLLRSHHSSCQGKATDYSDHIVLFCAQILPIPLTEVLFSFMAPFWRNDIVPRTTRSPSTIPSPSATSSSNTKPKTGVEVVPIILVTGLLYLYVISFIGAYKTVAFFHTRFEIFIGYLISLVIQIPLFLILTTSLMQPVRDYFFGRGM